jgi:capsular polysaccharide biosynthesis protein
VLAVAGVVTAVALLLAKPGPLAYSSTSAVLVNTPSNASAQNLQTVMTTEKKLAGSVAVAQEVTKELKLNQAPDDVLHGLSISVPLDTTVIQFHYVDQNPQEAQRRAQAFADSYLAYRSQQQATSRSGAIQTIQDQLTNLNNRLTTAAEQAAGQTDPKAQAAAKAEMTSLNSQIAPLQQQLAVLATSASTSGGSVIQPASAPAKSNSGKRVRDGLLGLAAGLALGIAAALVQDHFDDRIRGAADVEASLSAPVLGEVPRSASARRPDSEVITAMQDDPLVADGFRRLGVNVALAANRANLRTILVAGADHKDGSTLVTANLGVALANLLGKTVVLTSANAGDPRLERVFGLPSEPGLTAVLAAEASLTGALCKTDVVDLRVLPAGRAASNWSSLLAPGNGDEAPPPVVHQHHQRGETSHAVVSITHRLTPVGSGPVARTPGPRTGLESASVLTTSTAAGRGRVASEPHRTVETASVDHQASVALRAKPYPVPVGSLFNISPVLDELRQLAAIVLVDAPPLLTATDTALLLEACDAVLFVANARSLTRNNLSKVGEQVHRADAHVIGSVVVGGRPAKSRAHRFWHPGRTRA